MVLGTGGTVVRPGSPQPRTRQQRERPRTPGGPRRGPGWERPSCSKQSGGAAQTAAGSGGRRLLGHGGMLRGAAGGSGGAGSSDPLESLEPRLRIRLRSGPAAPSPSGLPPPPPAAPGPAPPRSPPPAPPPAHSLGGSETREAARSGAVLAEPPGAVLGAAEEGAMGAGRL